MHQLGSMPQKTKVKKTKTKQGLWISKHRTFKLHGVFSNTYPWSLTAQNTLLQEM